MIPMDEQEPSPPRIWCQESGTSLSLGQGSPAWAGAVTQSYVRLSDGLKPWYKHAGYSTPPAHCVQVQQTMNRTQEQGAPCEGLAQLGMYDPRIPDL